MKTRQALENCQVLEKLKSTTMYLKRQHKNLLLSGKIDILPYFSKTHYSSVKL